MRRISFAEADDDFGAVMDMVAAGGAPVRIVCDDGEDVVVASARTWAGMQETLYLLSSPNNARRLLDAVAGFDARWG